VFVFSLAGLSQDAGTSADNSSTAKTSGPSELPKLEKFDRSLLDAGKDPCTDFYQYTCSKWVAAHPISSDMPVSSTELPLFLYNQTILRNALEVAAANKQATGS